jgi:hypothetical protein
MIILTFLRTMRDIFVEAQAMRRAAARRYPFIRDWE